MNNGEDMDPAVCDLAFKLFGPSDYYMLLQKGVYDSH